MPSHFELITRIGVAAILGGIIGFERDLHGRHAGLRTHLIVAMASATFMVVSTYFVFFQNYDSAHHIDIDTSRIAASVVSGIGFLAGGAILRTGAAVQGLTTAAGLWLVTAIGMCSGAGMYIEGAIVTLMGLVALTLLRKFEDKDDQTVRRRVSITLNGGSHPISSMIESIKGMGVTISNFDYERELADKTVAMSFDVQIPKNLGIGNFIQHLEKQDGLRKVHVGHPQ